jgi:hypothetical protein
MSEPRNARRFMMPLAPAAVASFLQSTCGPLPKNLSQRPRKLERNFRFAEAARGFDTQLRNSLGIQRLRHTSCGGL